MNDSVTSAPAVRVDTNVVGDELHVHITGALDADAAPLVSQAFDRLLADGQVDFVVDLSAITVISSAGVGSLIAGVGQARDEGGGAHVASMSDVARHVLDMLDLIDFFARP